MDVTGLEPVTSRTSSGSATSCAKRPCWIFVARYIIIKMLIKCKISMRFGKFNLNLGDLDESFDYKRKSESGR